MQLKKQHVWRMDPKKFCFPNRTKVAASEAGVKYQTAYQYKCTISHSKGTPVKLNQSNKH